MKSSPLKLRHVERKTAHDAFGRISHGISARKQEAAADKVYLDPVIHERTRLAILTALYTAGEGRSFPDLRDALALTDGNLMAHIRTLEDAGLLERSKAGAGRASMTTVRLSVHGKTAFEQYLDQLEQLVHAARKH